MNIVLKNSMYLVFMQMCNYAIPLITLPYLTRCLGFYQYGVLNTAINIILYIILVIDFGFNLSATREISQKKNNFVAVSKIFTDVIFAKIILFFGVLVFTFLILKLIPDYQDVTRLVYFMLPQVLSSILFPLWLYQGYEKIGYAAFINVLGKCITIPLLLIFVQNSKDVTNAAIILSWSSLVPLLIYYIRSNLPRTKFYTSRCRFKYLNRTLANALVVFIGSIAVNLYTLSTPLVLSIVRDFDQVGYFVAADKIRAAFIGVFLIVGQAIYPRASALYNEDIIAYNKFVISIIFYQIIVCTFSAIAFYYFMPEVAPIILSQNKLNVEELSVIIKLMSPMIILIPLSVILANCVLLPQRKNKQYALVPIITVIIHMSYSIILCEKLGALGASYAILLTEIISCALLAYFTFKDRLIQLNPAR